MKKCPWRKKTRYYKIYDSGTVAPASTRDAVFSKEEFLECIVKECAAWDIINEKCRKIWGNK